MGENKEVFSADIEDLVRPPPHAGPVAASTSKPPKPSDPVPTASVKVGACSLQSVLPDHGDERLVRAFVEVVTDARTGRIAAAACHTVKGPGELTVDGVKRQQDGSSSGDCRTRAWIARASYATQAGSWQDAARARLVQDSSQSAPGAATGGGTGDAAAKALEGADAMELERDDRSEAKLLKRCFKRIFAAVVPGAASSSTDQEERKLHVYVWSGGQVGAHSRHGDGPSTCLLETA